MKNIVFAALFLLSACGGIENEKIDVQSETSNQLIVPPCFK